MPDHFRSREHSSRRQARMEEALRNDYIAAVRRESVRRLAGVRSSFDADDISSMVVERLAQNIEAQMVKYPDPVVYARVATKTTAIDFDRTQNSQRGAGARVVRGDDGEVVLRRTVVSGDRRDGESGGGIFDVLTDETDPIESLIASLDATEVVVGLLSHLPPRQAEALYFAKGLESDQTEIGARQQRRRETVCRDISSGMKALVGVAAELGGDDA
jgi:DNA-directed RNA polymerase specialized sigma24 family protein